MYKIGKEGFVSPTKNKQIFFEQQSDDDDSSSSDEYLGEIAARVAAKKNPSKDMFWPTESMSKDTMTSNSIQFPSSTLTDVRVTKNNSQLMETELNIDNFDEMLGDL